MKVSIIIPYFQRLDHLQQTLDSISKQSMRSDEYEIIVVDDGSNQSIERFVSSSIQLIRTHHRGAAAARNTGISVANGEVIIFLDNDIVIPPSFAQDHYNFHMQQSQMVALGFRLHMGPSGNVQTIDTRLKLLKRYGKNILDLQHPWFMTYTCNVSLKKDVVLKELFDENYIAWGLEDSEWAYRLHRRGCRFSFVETATAIHLYHDRTMTYEKFQGWKNNLDYTITKHPELFVLNFFKDVFDPLNKSDYFKAYDAFESTPCLQK